MKKIKVIIDIERMKHPYTGLYNYCENLYKNLILHQKQFLYYFFTPSKVKLPRGVNRINTHFWHKFYLRNNAKFKIWHITYQNSKYVPTKGIKVVLTIHDLNFLYTDKKEIKKKKLLKHIQQLINRADYITTISNYVLQDVQKHLSIGNTPIEVIPNGVALNKFITFDKPTYRPKAKFIFTIGTVLLKKNMHVLPRLISNLGYELIIAGIQPDNDYIALLKKEIKSNNVEDRVTLTGSISDEEKYWYMNNCTAFVFPSISEGFGIPPIEAMQLGKPVFLSTYTSLPEIGGDLAYYFDSFDGKSMQKVFLEGMEDYEVNNKKEAIISWANQFNWNKATKSYMDVYKKVLNIPKENKLISNKTIRKNKLSVLVITHNEEDNIIDLIKNINFADEIVIVDSYSDDNTLALISKFPKVRVIQNKFENFSKQRNFALKQVKNDWVLFIDADERISNQLKNEILHKLEDPKDTIAFHVKRDNYIADTFIKYSGWQNDCMTPLFNKNYVSYNEDKWVHETLTINGESTYLNNHLFHYTCKNYVDYALKMQLYSELKAKELFKKNVHPNFFHLQIKPLYRFFYHYVIKLGFLDGKNGKMIAKINALGVKNRFVFLKKLYKK